MRESCMPEGAAARALERIREKEILSNPFSTVFTRERRQ